MMSLLIVAEHDEAAVLAADLQLDGAEVRVISPGELSQVELRDVDALLLPPHRALLTHELVRWCDHAGVRLIPLGKGPSRTASRFGLPKPVPYDTPAWELLKSLEQRPAAGEHPADDESDDARVLAIWGPHGAPGRTTVAIQLAVELARSGRRTALVDADSVAPSVALQLGLGDDSPGLAAACRRAQLGSLDVAELARLATPVETSAGTVDVLSGLNRPRRWPELAAGRLRTTLATCRRWVDETVVDVSAAFDEDADPLDPSADLRNAATAATLVEADAVVAVLAADPLGVSRFLRGYAELRHLVGDTPVTVVANRVRPGPLGIDARGQVRRTLERFAGIEDVVFLPHDPRGADAAALHARPVSDVAPRSQLVAAVRRLAAGLDTRRAVTADSSRGSSRAARRPR